MKRQFLLTAMLLAALFVQNRVCAQDSKGFISVKGMNVLNAGIGLGSYGFSGTGGLPLTASFEHGFTEKISAGATLGIIQKKFASDWKYRYLMIGARGSYHLDEAFKIANPKVDVYAGAGLFYRRYTVKYTGASEEDPDEFDVSASGGDINFELHAGGRYLFNNSIGAFAELGYGISPLQMGVTFRF